MRKMMEAFVPPKPKEFDKTIFTFFSFAVWGTRSMPAATSLGSSRFSVGGRMPVSIALQL